MNHQDWKPVVFKKKTTKKQPQSVKSNTKSDDDDIKLKKFPPELVKQIIKYRVDKNMNRKQFAQFLNIRESKLAEIETNKALHNGPLVGRFKKLINGNKKN